MTTLKQGAFVLGLPVTFSLVSFCVHYFSSSISGCNKRCAFVELRAYFIR